MAIKDEIYVAYLLSREEKIRGDRDRYNVRPEMGDRMIHRHLNRPEFTFGRRTLRFHLKTRPWMLRLMRRAKFLRGMLPAWHAREKEFRAWYFALADRFVAPDRPRRLRHLAQAPAPAGGSDRLPGNPLSAHGRRAKARPRNCWPRFRPRLPQRSMRR